MKYKRHLFIFSLSIVICSCIVIYSMQLAEAKKSFHLKLTNKIQLLLEQQQELLQRLSKQLLESIKQQNLTEISKHLRIYEDQIFILAKQGLTIPVKIQWVSFNVPQIVVTSEGVANSNTLAPDQRYYLNVFADPKQLQTSNNYIKEEMPEYRLLNLGLSILDRHNNIQGLLDISISLTSLHAYLESDLGAAAAVFSFNLLDLANPEIVLNATTYWVGLLKFIAGVVGTFAGLWLLISYGHKLYNYTLVQNLQLENAKRQIATLTMNAVIHRNAAATQNKYGIIAADPETKAMQLIDISELLNDSLAVNAELAQIRNVTITLPTQKILQVYIFGNMVRLIQILSGIMYEVLSRLPANSTINVQLLITDLPLNARQFTFKFTDNGFYNTLDSRSELQSTADIRIKGWDNIQNLIAMEGGNFEYVHTAYSGNTISFSLNVKESSNVVNLENYINH